MFKKAYRFFIAVNDFVNALRGLVLLVIFALILTLASVIGWKAWALYSMYEHKIAAVSAAYNKSLGFIQEKADLSVAGVIHKVEQAAEVYKTAHVALAGQREEFERYLRDIAAQKEQIQKLLAVSRELSENQIARIQQEISALGDLKSAAANYAADALKREMLERELREAREKIARIEEQYEKLSGFLASQGGAAGEKAKELLQNLKRPFGRDKKTGE